MKKITFQVLFLLVLCFNSFAQTEQLLVNENFQSWTNTSATAATTIVSKSTILSNETLNYSLWGVSVSNSAYVTSAVANPLCSAGYLKMSKNTEITSGTMSIELSPLASITKIWFVECTTGSNRGFKVWKKNATDADWVEKYSTVVATSSGVAVNLTLNETNVALKFTNLSVGNYAFLTDLKIWGNVSGVAIPPTSTGLTPSNNSTIATSGEITVDFSEDISRGTSTITLGEINVTEEDIIIQNSTLRIKYSNLNTDSSYDLVIPAGAVKNAANTSTVIAVTATYKTPDTILPTLTKSSIENGATLPINGFISLVMSENCQAGTATISLGSINTNATVSASNGNLLYINYSGLAYDTEYTLTIPANAINDLSGNSYSGSTITFRTEVDAKGTELFSIIPDLSSFPGSSTGTIIKTINSYPVEFGGVASAGVRNASPYTYAFKCNYVLLPELPSVGELSFYLQSGGGSVPQEYYIQKLAVDGTSWNTLETFILGNNDRASIKSAAAQSSAPTRLRLMYNNAQLWFYNIDVYAFAANTPIDDGANPTVNSSNPAINANDVPINGTIKLIFSENVTLGTEQITLDGKTLTPSIIGKNVNLSYSNLKYATNYTLNVPASAFKDAFNNNSVAYSLNFNTKAKPAITPHLFNFIVAKDGSGNGTTIQSAFDAVAINNTQPYLIFVKNGTYNEYPTLVETKNNVSLIGQSKNGVIITGDRRSGLNGYTTSTCQTVEVLADNFYCENLTIQNKAGINAGQAVALKVYADKAVSKNIKLIGFQDTHLTSNTGSDRQYYQNCEIQGSVDFIFGNGVCYFDQCLLYVQDRNSANVIVAPSTTTGNTYGYVFDNCTIDGASTQNGIYNLGRPWQNSPKAVFLNTKMNILSSDAAWGNMSAIPALFAEYNTVNSSNNLVDISKRNSVFSYTDGSNNTITGSSPTAILSAEQAALYTTSNVLSGADSWNAFEKTEQTALPANIVLNSNILSWDAVEGAICYLIFRNDEFLLQTTSKSIQVTNGIYHIVAVSESGALSERGIFVVEGIISTVADKSENNKYLLSTIIRNEIELINYTNIKELSVYTLTGQKIITKNGDLQKTSIDGFSSGYYILKLTDSHNQHFFKVLKK